MSTLALPQLIARIVASGRFSESEARILLDAMTDSILASLQRSGSATVPGIGIFRVVTLGTEPSVAFAPDSTLAAEINAPFAMFEPMELPEGITELDIETEDDIALAEESTEIPPEEPAVQSAEESDEHSDENSDKNSGEESAIEKIPTTQEPEETEKLKESIVLPPPIPDYLKAEEHPVEEVENTPATSPDAATTPAPDASGTEPSAPPVEKIIEKERIVEVHSDSGHHTMNIVLFSIISLIAGLLIGYFISSKLNFGNVKNVNIEAEGVKVFPASQPETIAVEKTDSVSSATKASTEVDTASAVVTPSQTASVVLDTVRGNRYLTTMALEHYGKKKFWVYIYLENKSSLTDPDNIAPNTVVVIPPADKYGIKAGDKASEADAERQAQLVYRDNQHD